MVETSIQVAVIMAEYSTNQADLRSAISSILCQDHADFEFLIVDDCGTNDLGGIVAEFNDSRIRVIRNEKNLGLAESLNRMARYTDAEWLIRMDTDDISDPQRISALLVAIRQNPEYAVISSRAIQFNESGVVGIIGIAGEKTAKDVAYGDVPVHAAAAIRRNALLDVGGYPDYRRAEDLALWCELILNGYRLLVVPDLLYQVRVEDEDYGKRTLRYRGGELMARLYYYPKLRVPLRAYLKIGKSVLAGLAPVWLLKIHQRRTLNR